MKNAIALISNDWHLQRSNLDDILRLVHEKCQLAKKLNLKKIICLGDVFESRISQRMDVLITFSQILEVCKSYDLILVCIPGNHDKTDYRSEYSFLSPSVFHPNLKLIEGYECMENDEFNFHFIPYFTEDDKYIEYLNKVQYKGNDILFSHIAVQGSVNNDGTTIENKLDHKAFSKFEAVFLGHYHNFQELGRNFYHLPSIQQNNFGENENKGFTILYDDLSIEIVNNSSKRYKTVEINLNQVNIAGVNNIIRPYNPEKSHVRLVFHGDREKIKSVNMAQFQERGFVIQTKQKDIQVNTAVINTKEMVRYNLDHMTKLLKTFCDQKNLNYPDGIAFFNSAINEDSFSAIGLDE